MRGAGRFHSRGGQRLRRADQQARGHGPAGYSVTSAAELLADTLTAEPVRIVRTQTTERVSVTSYTKSTDAEGNVTFSDPETVSDPPVITYLTSVGPEGSEATITSRAGASSFLTRQTLELCFGSAAFDTAEAMALPIPAAITASAPVSLPLSVSIPAAAGSSAVNETINAAAVLNADGTLVITLNDKSAGAGDYFALRLTLTPEVSDVSQTLPLTTDTVPSASGGGDTITYTAETTVTEKRIRVSEITWTLSSVEKLTDPAAP